MINIEEYKKMSEILELSKILEIRRRGLKIKQIGSWLWVTGHTFNNKALLKSYKFKWNPNKIAWSYHNGGNYIKKTKNDYTLTELEKMFK